MSTDVGIGSIRENPFRKEGKVLVSKVTSADGRGLDRKSWRDKVSFCARCKKKR